MRNTDTLLGHGGFVGIKTGSDDAAGGCFMFQSQARVGNRDATIVGVVLGVRGGPPLAVALAAARRIVAALRAQLTAADLPG